MTGTTIWKRRGPRTELHVLKLEDTGITDAGLKRLKGATKLINLTIADCGISDAGLENLRALRQLESLSLSGTRITRWRPEDT